MIAKHIKNSPFYVVFNDTLFVKIGQRVTDRWVLFVMHDHFSPFKQC
jgi:hypothetical protein